MSQTSGAFDLAEQQRMTGALMASTLFPPATESLLAAQASLFVNGESVLMAWMSRRHEAILEAQRLVARMRECRDLSEAMQAQQEWMSAAFKRLSADMAGCQQVMEMLVTAAPEVTGLSAAAAGRAKTPANDGKPAPAQRAGTTRAAGDR